MRLRWDGKVKSNLNILKYVLPQTNAFALWLQYVSNLYKSHVTLEEPGFPQTFQSPLFTKSNGNMICSSLELLTVLSKSFLRYLYDLIRLYH